MNRHIIYKTQHLALLCKIRNTLVKYVADRVADVADVAFAGRWRNLVYALVLGTSGAILESSSLLRPTMSSYFKRIFTFFGKNYNSDFKKIGRWSLSFRFRMCTKCMPYRLRMC